MWATMSVLQNSTTVIPEIAGSKSFHIIADYTCTGTGGSVSNNQQ